MSELNHFRRHSLECLRLEADCMQLAGDLRLPAWQAHYLRMARVWRSLADLDCSLSGGIGHYRPRPLARRRRLWL
jgi:hypothetical protein